MRSDEDHGDNTIKCRRDNFMIELRRESRRELLTSRRQKNNAPVSYELMNQEVLKNFEKFKETLVLCSDPKEILRVLKKIRSIMTSSNDPENLPNRELFASNLPQEIIKLAQKYQEGPLKEPSLSIVNESIWILSNASVAGPEEIDIMVKMGLLPVLHDAMLLSNPKIIENSVYCLSNILAENISLRERMEQLKIVTLIFELVDSEVKNSKLMETVSWFLANTIRTYGFSSENLVVKYLGKILLGYVNDGNMILLECANGILFYLQEKKDVVERINFVSQLNIEERLKQGFAFYDERVVNPIMEIFNYLSYGSEDVVNKFVDQSFIQTLIGYISSTSISLQGKSVQILSNIILTNESYHKTLFTHEVFSPVYDLLIKSPHYMNSLGALQVITAFIEYADRSQLEVMVSTFSIQQVFISLLQSQHSAKAGFNLSILKSIECLLRKARAFFLSQVHHSMASSPHISELVELQNSSNPEVALLANQIICVYFDK